MRQIGTLKSSPEEEAAFWFARLRSDKATRRDRSRFEAWLAADPAHAAAYEDYAAFWAMLDDCAAADGIAAMRKDALALAASDRGWRWAPLTAVAATIAILLLGTLLLMPGAGMRIEPGPQVAQSSPGDGDTIYRTLVGQRSTVTLADGSIVELNTDSVLQVDYSEGRRNLRLLHGQALFDVAHDSARPFVVHAGDRSVTALGTKFDVRFRSGETQVTLIEGRVAVRSQDDAPAEERTLVPGQQLLAMADRPATVRTTDLDQAVSWRTGRVIFSNEPLGDVVEEINRYSTRRLVLADPSLADLRVSGIFRAGAVNRFASALDAGFPVESRFNQSRNEIVLSWE